MEKEYIHGKTAADMKVNIVVIRSMARAHTHTPMVVNTQENGLMGFSTVLGVFLTQRVHMKERVSGQMAS